MRLYKNASRPLLTEKPRIPIREILLFGFLPSILKVWLYRLRGYRIGPGVSIGLGSVVMGDEVVIGPYTEIGFLTIIRGVRIHIGAHVKIGTTTFLDTPHLEIGDGTKINEQVFVGGLQFPDSRLTVGRNCQIMQMSFINPARTITIGDDTGIGGHSLIFGHTSWLSIFEGYPVEFKSIEIGNSVSVAWRVFILPGTKIGDGSVIGADSLVYRTIPPRCMAVGFPARVVSRHPDFPQALSPEDRVRILKEIIDEMIVYWNGFGITCRAISSELYEMQADRKVGFKRLRETGRLRIVYNALGENYDVPISTASILLSIEPLPSRVRQAVDRQNGMWIDIASKERSDRGNVFGEEIAQFLRRYGVRLFRVKSA